MGFTVYFTSKEVGSTLLLGVVAYEDFEMFPEIIEERRTINETHYENELLAFKRALEFILEEGFDDIELINQNKLIFDWLRRNSHENTLRDTLYKQIKTLFREIVGNGAKISYRVVKGNKNEAKRYLDKYAEKIEITEDLTSLFTSADVLDFGRESRTSGS